MNPSALTTEALLRLWEDGEVARSGPGRAVTLLALAYPQKTRGELAKLSLGRRDERLLALRELHLGPTLRLSGECPSCKESIAVAFDIADLPRSARGAGESEGAGTHRFERNGCVVEFRLPDSTDLEAAAQCPNVRRAQEVLLERCVVAVTMREGSLGNDDRSVDLPLSADLPLSGDLLAELEEEIDRLDPLALVNLDHDCPSCAFHWQSHLDVSEIVWSELTDIARRVLVDVATLARLYHWSEQSVLAMSARRRRMYLELAEA